MKILLITQWFDPEPTFKGLLFAKELQKNGHEVEVITGFPNYPGGKVYDGYKISFYRREVFDNIVVHRVPLYPSHNRSALKRVFNYTSFALSSFLAGVFLTSKADVIYSYHPPLTTSLSSVLLGKLKKVPVVVDIQDLWPDTLSATGMLTNSRVLSVVNSVCNLVYRLASKIVVLSPGFKNKLIERGVPEQKIEIIYNWCNEPALLTPSPSNQTLPDNGRLNLVFAGNLGVAQDLSTIIVAAKLLSDRGVPVNFVFIGGGVSKDEAIGQSKELALDNVFFLEHEKINTVGSLLSNADILLVHLKKDELFRITIPSRTQANLAVGKPIVMGVSGDAAELILQSDSGFVCEPGNSVSLAKAIEKMTYLTAEDRRIMGENARNYYNTELSLAIGAKRFVAVFEEVQ